MSQHGAHDIGVFHWEGQFYAYSNSACIKAAGCEADHSIRSRT